MTSSITFSAMRLMVFTMAGLAALAGCKAAPDKSAPDKEPPKAAVVATQPDAVKSYVPGTAPTNKEVIRALLQIRDVGLSSSSTCSGVGTEPTDVTIGDYVSGFLAEQGSGKGANSIEVSTRAERGKDEAAKTDKDSPAGQAQGWRSQVMIRHVDGDDRWGWGVSFLMRPTDHGVVKESVRCVGAG